MAIVGVLLIVWLVDDLGGPRQVRRGTSVAGIDLSEREVDDTTDIAATLEPLRSEAAAIRIELLLNDRAVTATAEQLGVGIDVDAVVEAAIEQPPLLIRPAAWLRDFLAQRDIALYVSSDESKLEAVLGRVGGDPETPRIALVDGVFEAIAGEMVPVPDIDELVSMLEAAILDEVLGDDEGDAGAGGGDDGADDAEVTLEVPIKGMTASDPLAWSLASELADQANRITSGGATLRLGGTDETAEIGEEALRSLVVLDGRGQEDRLGDRRQDSVHAVYLVRRCRRRRSARSVRRGLLRR